MLDLLVISHACFISINRKVYQRFAQDGFKVAIVAPETLMFPSGVRRADPALPEDPELLFRALQGQNPRTYTFKGLDEILSRYRPKVILLDNDPVSRMAGQLGQWCSCNNSRLFCISCENLSLGLSDAIRRRGFKNLPAALVKRMFLHRNRSLVHGVFCINQDGVRIFNQEGFRNVRHMPLGFDPAVFHLNTRAGLLIRDKYGLDGFVIGYFGRLTREKGIHILIASLSALKDLPWKLMMDRFDAYASPYHGEVESLIEAAGIRERIVFVHPDHYEIAAYMSAVDAVVVPSITAPDWKEQYGRVAAEALACGKTVIASNSGALPELLGGHGIVFEEGNTASLSRILSNLIHGIEKDVKTAESIAAYASAMLSIDKQYAVLKTAFTSGK